ncbi:MAG: DUF6783 domain-containing protein [Ruminococcus sp.]|nr:DUF6783 domain-containing protein [Ruminococcus sp.]
MFCSNSVVVVHYDALIRTSDTL